MKNKKMFIILVIIFIMNILITASVTYVCTHNYHQKELLEFRNRGTSNIGNSISS